MSVHPAVPSVARPERGGMLACLSAMSYVGVRRWARRLRGVAGKPWPLLGLLVGVALFAGLQLLALDQLRPQAAPDPAVLDPVVRFVPLVLPILLFNSTFHSPLRLRVAAVSWVLTAPGGTRAAFLAALLLRPVRYAVIGYLATLVSRWSLGLTLTEAWKVALVGAAIGLVLRLTSFGGHILVVRARAALALRALAVAWGVGMLAGAVVGFPGSGWLGLRPLVGWLLVGAVRPERLSPVGLLMLLAGLVAAAGTLVAAARGYEERAETAARQIDEAQVTMRRSRSGQELMEKQFRTGQVSLPVWPVLAGERALCFRGMAQQRRLLRPNVISLVVGLTIALILLALAPDFTWAPAALLLVNSLASSGASQGLAVELDHYHLRLAPMRPLPALAWLGAVPVTVNVVQIEVVWLPVLAAPGVPTGVGVGGVVLIPCLVALAEAAGSLVVTVADGLLVRIALALALGTLGALPAAALAVAVVPLGSSTLLVTLAAVALLTAAASLLTWTAYRVWPRRRTPA